MPALLPLLCLALIGPPADEPRASVLRQYQVAKAKAGRDPGSLVKLALWCEAHGLDAERGRHLAAALLADPANVTARGLMGLVRHGGEWLSPDRVAEKIQSDTALSAKLAEYNKRRGDMIDRLEPKSKRKGSRADAARAHVLLGLWCEQAGLKDEATAHYTSAVVLNPHDDSGWKHLGYTRQNGRWMSREQVEAERQEADARRKADAHWEPLLKKWRTWLEDRSEARRQEARAMLAGVSDPLAVPAIVRVFVGRRESDQLLAVQLLGQIDTPASSRALAELAVRSASEAVRSGAIATLRHREPRDFAGPLVEMIHSPWTYEAQTVGGPGQPGGLIVDTPRFRMLRRYDAPNVVQMDPGRNGYIGYDQNGLPLIASNTEMMQLAASRPGKTSAGLFHLEARTAEIIAAANLKAEVSQRRLMADIQAIERRNDEAATRNGWVIPVLAGAMDAPADLKDDEDAWHKWYYDRIGYRYESPPKLTLTVDASPQTPPPVIVSCFVAGTQVRTLDGHRPIETLQVGDRVLAQDVTTGELSFQPVTVVHRNTPGATVRIKLDNGETLTASLYHRFWHAGRGWGLARDVRSGDTLRTLGGRSKVASVEDGPTEALFNLDVARSHTYFVGERDALVHDNTLPPLRVRPFDAEPTLVGMRPGK